MPKGSWREFDDVSPKTRPENLFRKAEKAEKHVRVQKTRVGKGGKTVTVVTGLDLEVSEAKALLKTFKASCGTGGTVKDGLIELQGDQVNGLLKLLQREGYCPRKSGG